MVGVILTKRFVAANTKKFQSYVNYIDRDEATRKEKFESFSLYNDYMDNPNKLGGLFTHDKDSLSEEEKKRLKNQYSQAQQNNSIMWQDVISFDNAWLEKHGLYDSKTKTLDEKKLMEATRSMMKVAEEKEELSNFFWSASFHFNTDNIHIHVASLEMTPNEKRKTMSNELKGRFKPQTLDKMKSKFINTVLDRQQNLKNINDIIRQNIIKDRPDDLFQKDKKFKQLMKQIIADLPEDKKQWHYGYNTVNVKKIDMLTSYYIETYKKEEFEELKNKLKKEENFLKETYGSGNNQSYKNYSRNKIDDLYKRMGNNFLSEIKNMMKEKNSKLEPKRRYKYQKKNILYINQNDVNNIKKVFNKDIQNLKNQQAYKKLNQQRAENENEYER